ncbi:MAG TPA: IS66 family transposase [Xenococcaceae cyanobacterium]|jgi:predicted RecB family nuclease
MNVVITSEVLQAYSLCPRKAYLLMYGKEQGTIHEYEQILTRNQLANKIENWELLQQKHIDIYPYSISNLEKGHEFLIDANLIADNFQAYCPILTRVNELNYEPTIFIGTHTVNKTDRLKLMFINHVLTEIQGKSSEKGYIINVKGKSRRLKLEESYKVITPLLEPLQEWLNESSSEEPPVILNKHCPLCQFRESCQAQAIQEDNLSRLDRMTPKSIRQYERKGIFTVKQLSYLFKPRKRKKRNKKAPLQLHKLELQALAIRTQKIYIDDLPQLNRKPVEIFLDIEGIPDQQYEYLIGLLVCDAINSCKYHSFWADTREDEVQVWQQFIEIVNQYTDAPIFHYGNYEVRALAKFAKRYESDIKVEEIEKRLVNINTHIYGHIYFPVYSNGLKTIGKFIGATWTSSEASGLQSIVWRYLWEDRQDDKYRELLLTYNREDCQALKLLTEKLSEIENSADTLSEVNFADQPKRLAAKVGIEIHNQFETILQLAHEDYDKKKISLRRSNTSNENKKKRGGQKGHPAYSKLLPKANKIIFLPTVAECPEHKGESLRESKRISECTVVDLIFVKSGIKKTVIKYRGKKSFCHKCNQSYQPPELKITYFTYGHGFQSWVVYNRLFLRLPYRVITQTLEDQFGEKISESSISNFLRYFSKYYAETEQLITRKILESPFIHADETPINIQGVEQYVWVFSDGKHVIFKLTSTREAEVVHKLLSDYSGTLISDFYPGYDSVKCKQQKCWVHLIRDLNNELWKSPFDSEFEGFIVKVRNLIVPILKTVEEHGLKKRKLSKFNADVSQFYKETIKKNYKSDLVLKYKKRFLRYEHSLFTFLEEDNIPWNNNAAERAIRHLAVQRKISGSFFESLAPKYLMLLGIMQTCRFQGKSLLKFLLSKEKDVDRFK